MNTATVLQRIKKGEVLHLQYIKCAPAWQLASGARIQDKVARAVVRNSGVSDGGDALFADAPSQTWRWGECPGIAPRFGLTGSDAVRCEHRNSVPFTRT
jgi:hypothetical protein